MGRRFVGAVASRRSQPRRVRRARRPTETGFEPVKRHLFPVGLEQLGEGDLGADRAAQALKLYEHAEQKREV
jgi:xanthine/CO dehydrogenase XdhC/CoxF family maturation factor